MLRVSLFLSALCLICYPAYPVFAQFSTDENPISAILTPEYPRPYQTVIVSPRSSLIDLSASTVTISVNGAVIQKGSGTQGASITTGGPGETTNVAVTVQGPDGKTYVHKIAIHPADVALVVEPATTAHPFYKGLTLTAPEGRVRLVAIPDLRTNTNTPIDPAKLVYTWKLGDRVLQDASGLGRSVLVANAPVRYRDADITLMVTSQDSGVVAQARTTISPRDPLVRMYSYDPLMGPDYDHAITSTFSLDSTEGTFRAVPYFFAAPPSIEWSVGGKAQGAQRDITVRSTGSGQGSASLEIRAKLAGSLQVANNRIVLRFGDVKSPLSIFGL